MKSASLVQRILLPVAIGVLLTACSEKSEQPDWSARQSASIYGDTRSWQVDDLPWKEDVQSIRDRAYAFCDRAYSNVPVCQDTQDQSIKTAVDVERAVKTVIETPEKSYVLGIGEPLGDGIALQPDRYAQARQYCFSVYEDAGAQDARFLGPCMSSTVSWDYFGFMPIP